MNKGDFVFFSRETGEGLGLIISTTIVNSLPDPKKWYQIKGNFGQLPFNWFRESECRPASDAEILEARLKGEI